MVGTFRDAAMDIDEDGFPTVYDARLLRTSYTGYYTTLSHNRDFETFSSERHCIKSAYSSRCKRFVHDALWWPEPVFKVMRA